MVISVRRLTVFLCFVALAGCECVSVPPREYACEEGARCEESDAGGGDAGVGDAGPDAGEVVDGGIDAGTDGGPVTAADMCNTWACVTAAWPTPSPGGSGISSSSADLPADVDGGTWGWFGGVLLPDGRVLAIAHTSSRFLLLDPVNLTSEVFGPELPAGLLDDGMSWRRLYAGGVLHPNGMVYVFPYHERSLLELNPFDGGARNVGRNLELSDGGYPHYVGGVVDRYGFVWSASELSATSVPMVRFDPRTGDSELFTMPDDISSGWGGWWGMARLPDDTLLAFPKEYANGKGSALSPHIIAIEPGATMLEVAFTEVAGFDLADAGFALQGGSLTFEGAACATPAGSEARYVCVTSNGGSHSATIHDGPSTLWGFNGTFSDGRVWTTPDDDAAMVRVDANGQTDKRTVNNAVRYGYLGLVASPQGMVLVPGSPSVRQFLVVKPGALPTGDTRPMSVLLSPYFNKL